MRPFLISRAGLMLAGLMLAGFVLAGLSPLGSVAGAQVASPVGYSQVTRPVVLINDPALIKFLLFELFIEPLRPPTRLQVIDVTLNGYGPDDVIIVFPSMEAYQVPEAVPDTVQRLMGTWAPAVEFRLDAGNLPSNALAALITSEADSGKRAENAILFEVVQAVERNYRDLPVGLLFERDSVGFTFQLWDYNRPAMSYRPRAGVVTDSAVNTVVSLLKDVGYVPERGGAEARAAGRMVSVDRALAGIRTFPDELVRQLAARTLLVGSFDLDRSGAIDAAREVDAIPCDVWVALNGTFQGGLAQFGFADPAGAYSGNMVFGISESVRAPASRRAEACLSGTAPAPTTNVGSAAAPRPVVLPTEVSAFASMDAAAEIVARAGKRVAGSAEWATEVRRGLVPRYDADSSGRIDRRMEVASVPCAVWQAIASTHATMLQALGFVNGGSYMGDRIGIDAGVRVDARARIEACATLAQPSVTRRMRTPTSVGGPVAVTTGGYSPVDAIAGLRSLPEDEKRFAARTLLMAFYDGDHSGYLDTGRELDAIPCQVWGVLADVFPRFAEEYGFVAGPGGVRQPFRGNIAFNIAEHLAEPTSRRVTACRDGVTPPPTRSETPAAREDLRLPASLVQFIDMTTAVRIAHQTQRVEPGSAAWAAIIHSVLLEEYDLDGSGMLDATDEIGAVPCVVWHTVRATFGSSLTALGFGGTNRYVGDRIGIAATQREEVTRRLQTCAG